MRAAGLGIFVVGLSCALAAKLAEAPPRRGSGGLLAQEAGPPHPQTILHAAQAVPPNASLGNQALLQHFEELLKLVREEPRHVLGVPKVAWALGLAMASVITYIFMAPVILTIIKRKTGGN
ncbi:HERC1 [Symbiodinium microadriaticum]|nr:HERC1 [Symbiodinium microadriaticum]